MHLKEAALQIHLYFPSRILPLSGTLLDGPTVVYRAPARRQAQFQRWLQTVSAFHGQLLPACQASPLMCSYYEFAQ
ncbi:hypothetical protein D3C84_917500 [compost metagenome]